MSKLTKIVIHSLETIFLVSCIHPFDESSYDFERSVVVDGLLTDEYKNHQILLNYTTPIGEYQKSPISGAQLWIENNSGDRINFAETASGVYSSEMEFAGEPGKIYQLFFKTGDGNLYQSDKVELIDSPPIDSIYNKKVDVAPEGETQNVGGIHFFLDSHDDTGNAQFYRYEWEEDYKIVTPIISRYTYFQEHDSIATHADTLHLCYGHDYSKSILIANSVGFIQSRIVEFPVRFISGKSDLLRHRYALLVRQYAVSTDAYNYYRRFKELNESGGSLIDTQQGSIAGNIKSMENPLETVLGYFEVSGISELRMFFDFSDLDQGLERPPFRYACRKANLIEMQRGELWLNYTPSLRIYRLNGGIVHLAPKYCADCSGYASTQKPDYWID